MSPFRLKCLQCFSAWYMLTEFEVGVKGGNNFDMLIKSSSPSTMDKTDLVPV